MRRFALQKLVFNTIQSHKDWTINIHIYICIAWHTCVWDWIYVCIWTDSTFFLGWISVCTKSEQRFLNAYRPHENREICWEETFFCGTCLIFRNFDLLPLGSLCLRVCVIVYYVIVYIHSWNKISVQVKRSNFVVQTRNCL